jgi:hypothetical protein
MEVHHHSHPAAAGHRKKWSHYFWEFLMLFLAVFCGFIAEYQLEHKIEKEKVRKYMHDMVENLKYDTLRVSLNAGDNKRLHVDLDSFRFELRHAIEGKPDLERLYNYFLRLNEFGVAAFNKSAITQLKNSGNLRLVKNDSLLNEMLDYYERKVAACEIYQREVEKCLDILKASSTGIFSTLGLDFVSTMSDSSFSPELTAADNRNIQSALKDSSLKLLSMDPKELEMLYTQVFLFERSLVNYNRFLNYTRKAAEKLMVDVREEY